MKKTFATMFLIISCIATLVSIFNLFGDYSIIALIILTISIICIIITVIILENSNKQINNLYHQQQNYYQNQMQSNYNQLQSNNYNPNMTPNFNPYPPPKKSNTAMIITLVLIGSSLITCCLLGNITANNYKKKAKESSLQSEKRIEEKKKAEEEQETKTTVTKAVIQKTTKAKTTVKAIETTAVTTTVAVVTHRTDEDIIGISNKDLKTDNISVDFTKDVPDDVTGHWRTAKISNDIDFKEYAVSYYNEYIKDDNEVHGVIVSGNMVRISVTLNELNISYLEYTDGEENSAKTLFSGKEKEAYCIYLDNGDIEQLPTWEDIKKDWNAIWGIEEESQPEERVIYEDNGFKMIYKGLSKSLSGISVDLYIENNSGQKATVQCRNFCINDFEINNYFSCEVNDGKKANDDIFIFNSTLDENGLSYNSIEKIEFSFNVFDENFDTIFDSPMIVIDIDN